MSLMSEIHGAMHKGPPCTFRVMREALDPADLADLDAAMANEGIPSTAISKGLTSIGRPISGSTVQRHRRGECSCGAR